MKNRSISKFGSVIERLLQNFAKSTILTSLFNFRRKITLLQTECYLLLLQALHILLFVERLQLRIIRVQWHHFWFHLPHRNIIIFKAVCSS